MHLRLDGPVQIHKRLSPSQSEDPGLPRACYNDRKLGLHVGLASYENLIWLHGPVTRRSLIDPNPHHDLFLFGQNCAFGACVGPLNRRGYFCTTLLPPLLSLFMWDGFYTLSSLTWPPHVNHKKLFIRTSDSHSVLNLGGFREFTF